MRQLCSFIEIGIPVSVRIGVAVGLGTLSLAGCGYDAEQPSVEATSAAVTAQDLGLPIVTRAQWGAASAGCSSTHSPYRVTIHHTETPNNDGATAAARVRGIQAYHQNDRGWCDIGYHFVVAPDGTIFEGRPMQKLGSHVGGNNTGNIGIAFLGSYDTAQPPAAQLHAAAQLAGAVANVFGFTVDLTTLRGHRDYTATSCPGNALYGHLGEIRDDANGESLAASAWIRGVASDATTDARLANASITLSPGAYAAAARSDGYWELLAVPFGTYTLSVSAPGYATKSVTITLNEAERWSSLALSRGYTATAPASVLAR